MGLAVSRPFISMSEKLQEQMHRPAAKMQWNFGRKFQR
jgi:hypothetical protein